MAKSLPRLLPETQTQSIFAKDAEPATRGEWLATPLKAFGSTRQPWRPPIEQTAKQIETKLLEYAKPPGAAQPSSKGLVGQWVTALKQSPVGWIFISTNVTKINATVLGSPYGNAAIVVDVIEALTKMQVASLTEDTYGKATPTVPDTVRTFTKTLNLIEDYVSHNKQGIRGGIEEVEIIIERLRASLKELLSAFQVYLIDQGLGIGELNQAKKAIQTESSKPPQSQERSKPQPKQVERRSEKRLFQPDRLTEKRFDQERWRNVQTDEVTGRKGTSSDRDDVPKEGYGRRELRPERELRRERHMNESKPAERSLENRAMVGERLRSWTLPRNDAGGPLFQRSEMEEVK